MNPFRRTLILWRMQWALGNMIDSFFATISIESVVVYQSDIRMVNDIVPGLVRAHYHLKTVFIANKESSHVVGKCCNVDSELHQKFLRPSMCVADTFFFELAYEF